MNVEFNCIKKYLIQLFTVSLIVFFPVSCEDKDELFNAGLDTESISIDANGGIKNIKIRSNGKWIASTEVSWISVSPVNGIGTTECLIKIDSTLLAEEDRQGIVRFVTDSQNEAYTLKVVQSGFVKILQLSTTKMELPAYGEFDKREFEVELTANVEFDVKIPDDVNWLSVEKYNFELDRGSRPRSVKLKFKWENNSRPWERMSDIQFKLRNDELITRHDSLRVIQSKAPLIEDNAEGDSLAIIGCMRSLGRSMGSNEGESMDKWDFVTLWHASDEGVNPADIGRVRSVSFASFAGKEGIPYEIRFLTRAETISFISSDSYLQGKFSSGKDISELTQLKNLMISSFGLVELDPSFVKLKNLEVLDLSGNAFSKVPDILTPENFPNLVHLNLNSNRRWYFNDLNNPPSYVLNFGGQETWGGFLDNKTFPTHLLKWEKLEYLGLSNNLIHGRIPEMDDYEVRYTAAEVNANDTLPSMLTGTPKVLPNAKVLRLNLNLLSGEIPQWVLYHPNMWMWDPFTLLFYQDESMFSLDGSTPGFTNAPVNWNYYWEKYPLRKPDGFE